MPTKTPTYPGRATGRGKVLAVLLSNQDQTGAEPLQGRVTLPAIVKSLKRKYHWPIQADSFPSNSGDGRATWATVYSLSAAVIEKALRSGGQQWLDG